MSQTIEQVTVVTQPALRKSQKLTQMALYKPDGTPLVLGTSTLVIGTTAGTAADAASTTTALNAKSPIASPTFTGTPAAPTAAVGTKTTQLATTDFVLSNAGKSKTQIAALATVAATAPAAAAGANPTKAEYDVAVAAINELRTLVTALVTALKA